MQAGSSTSPSACSRSRTSTSRSRSNRPTTKTGTGGCRSITNAALLYYRTDIVKTPPKTWEDVLELAKQGQQAHPDMAGFVFQGAPYEGGTVDALEFVYGANGQVLSEDGSTSSIDEGDGGRAGVRIPAPAVRRGRRAEGRHHVQEEDARLVFQNGGAIFMRNWPYAMPLMNGDDLRRRGQVRRRPAARIRRRAACDACSAGENYAISALLEAPRARVGRDRVPEQHRACSAEGRGEG